MKAMIRLKLVWRGRSIVDMVHPARVLVVVRPRERVRLEGSTGGQC